MTRCRICKTHEAEWSWQPWGPDEKPRGGFTTPGSHYRGFPVVPVCDYCKTLIEHDQPVEFTRAGVHSGVHYRLTGDALETLP